MINHIINWIFIVAVVFVFVTCDMEVNIAGVRIRKLFAWYDLWIGIYWDRKKKELYVFPVPCFGIHISNLL